MARRGRLPFRTWTWFAAVSALLLFVALRIGAGTAFNTDILALLPEAERDPAIETAVGLAQAAFEHHLLVVVGGAVPTDKVVAAVKQLREQLLATGFVTQRATDHQDGGLDAMGQLYLDHRFGLVSDELRPLLLDEARTDQLERLVLRQYFGPGGPANSSLIARDPLLLFPGFIAERQAMAGAGNFQMMAGETIIRSGDESHAVLTLTLLAPPYDIQVQQAVMPVIEAAKARAAPMTVRVAGVLPHAAEGVRTAEREVSNLGLISLIGVALLLVLPFRSLRPLLLGLVVIGGGVLTGVAACMALFGSIHLLTLVFAVSLVGISIDFVLHFLSSRLRPAVHWQAESAFRKVRPAMMMALLTTSTGYLGLVLSGFPGLVQITVFSVSGLTGSFLTAMCAYPFMVRSGAAPGAKWVEGLTIAWIDSMARPALRSFLYALFGVVALAGIWGMFHVQGRDDVRQFQALDAQILAEEQEVRRLLGNDIAGPFMVVTGRSSAEVLGREEAARQVLASSVADGSLKGILALSQFVPSPARQTAVITRLQNLAAEPDGLLETIAGRVGLQPQFVSDYRDALAQARPLQLEDWLKNPASSAYQMLWLGAVETADGDTLYASILPLRGVSDLAALQALDLPAGVTLVDPADDISRVFASYRERAVLLIASSFSVVTLLFLFRYGVAAAVRLMAPPCLAVLGVLAVAGLTGQPLTLFHIMALMLVLGLGVDYGIFFQEADRGDWTTFAAVTLSALTTLLGFGLLGLSETAVVAAFGQTLAIGITIAFFAASFVRAASQPAFAIPEKIHVT